MDQRYLRYFIAVAEELNFTRAAERLHTVQPSLSQQIRRLEDIVGTPLFFRERHRLELTEAGRIFLTESRDILQHTTRAITLARKAARAEAGHITIGFVSGAESRIFLLVLPVLREKYPEIRLSMRTLNEPDLLSALQDNTINLAFMAGPIEDPEITAETMYRQRLVAVLPAEHRLAKQDRVSVAELATMPFVQPSAVTVPSMAKFVASLAAQAGVQFRTSVDVADTLATLNAVRAGLGFAIMPDHSQEISMPSLAMKPLDLDPEPMFEQIVAYRMSDRLPALQFFLSLLREHVIGRLDSKPPAKKK